MSDTDVTYVEKACAYVTRGGSELLTFEGPGHDGRQIPKGTVETGEEPRAALYREVIEESGVATFHGVRHLATDVWVRRDDKRYVRHFYHVPVHEPRDAWTHVVTGEGAEVGAEFDFSWVDLSTVPDTAFALDLDDYVHALAAVTGGKRGGPAAAAVADDSLSSS
ncbi:ADP-ribose pyrophosphatase YjhB (NUDIX family) [Halarchaeum rubridurum]|nr:NUDIX domain-containing protein [Halarchaeum rubridurum]MBP1953843.1 ADP-ribose pyrophosphatase YjhB (NUDIX family) [Halarchaeum rubridurum]